MKLIADLLTSEVTMKLITTVFLIKTNFIFAVAMSKTQAHTRIAETLLLTYISSQLNMYK